MKVKRIAGYVGGEDGVGTGAEAAIDEVGVGKRAHHKKGQKTDQKQKGDEEFLESFGLCIGLHEGGNYYQCMGINAKICYSCFRQKGDEVYV